MGYGCSRGTRRSSPSFSKAGSNVVESAVVYRGGSSPRRTSAGRSSPKRLHDTEHAGDDTTQVVDPKQRGCPNETAAVDGGVLVVSGREPAPVFEAVERTLDDVTAAVGVAVVGDWPGARSPERSPDAQAGEQWQHHRSITGLARGEQDDQRRPRPSTAAWIFVLSPPRDLPRA